MDATRPDKLTLAAFVALVVCGGANAVAVRFSNAELLPFWGATLRFAAAAAILLAVVFVRRLPLPRGRALAGTLVYGALNFGLSYALLYWGLQRVQAGLTQVVLALAPLLTIFFAYAHGLEKLRWRPVVGALLSLAGMAVVFAEQISAAVPAASLVAILLSAVCIAEAGVLVKRFPQSHPVTTNAVAMTFGALMLLIMSRLRGEAVALPTQPATWAAITYLVLVGSIGLFTLFIYVVKRWTASATAYALVLMPFIAVLAGGWLRGERVTGAFGLGAALVLAGVYVGALSSASRRRPAREAPADALDTRLAGD